MKHDYLIDLLRTYIRLRDKGQPCISCGRTYARMDMGHYYGKGAYPNLKYDENNVAMQCRRCNHQGNAQGYRNGLLERHGQKFLDDLEIKARACTRLRLADKDLLMIYFNKKIKALEE